MRREQLIRQLKTDGTSPYDMIVIGGGATGVGIALDSVTRGYNTLLLEQSDFAKGTSSRSTKLVHGGVRYLAKGDLFLVIEALRERGKFLNNAPHLTENQEFIIPVYSVWDKFLYSAGLKFYDILSGNHSLGKSYFIGAKEVVDRLPTIRSTGLKGGVVYHDGQFDDARMIISLAKETIEKGGTVLNYFKVDGLRKDDRDKITGVSATDEMTGEPYHFESRLVVNATGVFSDQIHRLDYPESKPSIRPSQGVHIVLKQEFLQSDSAIMIPKTVDGRVLFAIPWYGKVVVGTTDTPVETVSLEPRALEEEIEFILDTAGKYLTKKPVKEDIECVFTGLRPLAADPNNQNSKSTKEISRRHKIGFSKSGLLSVTGGKWTTYRLMAEETIDAAIRAGFLEKRKCTTHRMDLSHLLLNEDLNRLAIYGRGRDEIQKMIEKNPDLGLTIVPDLPYTIAEIIWICRNEMPCTLDDVLSRRTRSLILSVEGSRIMAPFVAKIMAQEFGFDSSWEEEQIEEFNKLSDNYKSIY